MSAIKYAIYVVFLAITVTNAHALTLTIVNNEAVPLTMTIRHRNHCFQTNDTNAVNGKISEIPPKGSLKLGFWHAGDWRGCGGTAGEFVLEFSPSPKIGGVDQDKIGYWFDRGQGFGILNNAYPNHFPGNLTSRGSDFTFTTNGKLGTPNPSVTATKAIGSWESVCEAICNRSTSKETSTQTTKESTRSQETMKAISVSLEAGVEFGPVTAKTSVMTSEERRIGQQMSESFQRGETNTDTSNFVFTPEQMRDLNIYAVWQWVARTRLNTGEMVMVRSNRFTCTADANPPKYRPGDKASLKACSGGLAAAAEPAKPAFVAAATDLASQARAQKKGPGSGLSLSYQA